MSRLKLCPFCWGEVPRAYPTEVKGKAVAWRVHCPECGACGPAEASLDEAIRRWNLWGEYKDLLTDVAVTSLVLETVAPALSLLDKK